MMFGLKTETIEAIREVLAKYPEVEKAILYGSRAIGNYRPGSDIDLTLIGEKLNLSTLQKMENELDDLLLPYKIDLSLHKQIQNKELLEHIERVGKVFFDRNPAATPKPQNSNHLSEWREVKLGKFIITNKKSISKDYTYSKILYLDTGSITCNKIESLQEFDIKNAPSRAKRLVENEDIIYSLVRPNQLHYGYIKDPQKNLVVSTGFVTITCKKDKLHPLFLYYYLIQPQTTEYLHSIAEASTSAYPSLKPSDIESLEIFLPPLPEQTAIAEVLSSLDDKIDLLHRQNKNLEALAETLFRQWFVEEAKEDWEEVELGSVVETTSGGTPSRSNMNFYQNGTIPWVKSKELKGSYILETEELITDEALKKSSAKILPENSILIAMYGATVGEYAIIAKEMTCNQAVCALKPNINYPHTYLFLLIKHNKQELINMAVGSAQQNISQLLIKQMLVPNCIEIIREFHLKVEPLFQKIKSNTQQILTLTQLRDTLLPKLMSGEVRVSAPLI
jgi:type I restriction enzyme S subunit